MLDVPEIFMNKSDIQLNEKESLAIVCAAAGKPSPKVLQGFWVYTLL
jgi:hypothetical protein